MNVGELRAHLEKFDDSLDILTANDDEGNGYRPLNYVPSISFIYKNEDKHGYIDSLVSEDELVDDEEDEGWDRVYRGRVEPRLVIG